MKNLNTLHLNGLRAVEAVGRLGSLRAAADELSVTVGAVSQQVQKTETQLGKPLFIRDPKGLRLTALGEDVLVRLTAGMAELSAGVALARNEGETVLTVSTAPVFAGKWLVWRLNRFHEAHPNISIRIDANSHMVDPDLSDVDVCIRVGQGGWRDVKADKILDHKVFPVCSPGTAETLSDPGDMAKVPIIRDPLAMFGWDSWLRPNGLNDDILGDGPVYSDASMCLDAAIAGQGIFLAWETLANDAIRMGRLVAPFPGRHLTGLSYWFVTGRRAERTRKVRAFRAWLEQELTASIERD